MTRHLEVRREIDGDVLILQPCGDIDLERAPSLRESLNTAQDDQPRVLVVDLTEVPYMDSSGVATLVEALQHSRRDGRQLVLFGLQDRVRSMFEIARLDIVFTITDSLDAARSGG